MQMNADIRPREDASLEDASFDFFAVNLEELTPI